MPIGLTNAPGTFQSVMNNLFSPPKFCADGSLNSRHKLSEFALVLIDDILVFSKSAVEHKQHLDAVMAVLREDKV